MDRLKTGSKRPLVCFPYMDSMNEIVELPTSLYFNMFLMWLTVLKKCIFLMINEFFPGDVTSNNREKTVESHKTKDTRLRRRSATRHTSGEAGALIGKTDVRQTPVET